MSRGGARPGAGRPKGSKSQYKRASDAALLMSNHAMSMAKDIPPEIANMTPLQVMLKAMTLEAARNNWKQAAVFAEKAAPYVHPRLSAIDVNANVRRTIDEFSDEELIMLAGASESADGDEAPDSFTH